MKVKIKRNGFIDVMRLIFSLLIVEFHFYESGEAGVLPLGQMGVEFFVIVSGFLFYSSWEKRTRGENPPIDLRLEHWKTYMIKRYMRFFWPTFFAFLGYFLVIRIWMTESLSLNKVVNWLSSDIWEILLLKMTGLNRGKLNLLNNPAWMLSSMLLAEFFILGMLVWCRKFFLSFFLPLSMVCTMGYWINIDTAAVEKFLGLFTFGTLRVYFVMKTHP